MKKDARVRYTKMVLKNALLELMETKPMNKITVKEICERAQLNRATFYKHYSDCYELLESIENDIFKKFAESIKNYVRAVDVTDLVSSIYDIINDNEKVCRTLIFNQRGAALVGRMIAYAHDISVTEWGRKFKRATVDEIELLYLCLSNGLFSAVVEGYDKFGKDEIIHFVDRVFKSVSSAFI